MAISAGPAAPAWGQPGTQIEADYVSQCGPVDLATAGACSALRRGPGIAIRCGSGTPAAHQEQRIHSLFAQLAEIKRNRRQAMVHDTQTRAALHIE